MRTRATLVALTSIPALLTVVTSGDHAPTPLALSTTQAAQIDSAGARMLAQRSDGDELAHAPADHLGFLTQSASRTAVAQRDALAAQSSALAATAGTWRQYGTPPVLNNTSDYQPVDAIPTFTGRVADFADDPATGRIWVAVGVGGIWESPDLGTHWRNLTDSLASTTAGGVAFSPSHGGTLIDGTGDFAGGYVGLGVYRSTDDGAHWQHSTGVPDGFLTSKVAVDPTNPDVVYVATSRGLYRSADDGVSFRNVDLPVPPTKSGGPACAGDTTQPPCAFANEVTDVVVRTGDSKDKGGEVMAAVGWERGDHETAKGWNNSLGNGLYVSPTGLPGTFTNLDASSHGFTPQSHIGHVSLGNAIGPDQNHDVVWAMVQDAQKENGYFPIVDPPAGVPAACATANCYSTELDNIYESSDFGKTWTKKLPAAETLGVSCPVSSTDQCLMMAGPAPAGLPVGEGYAPGIQARYNNWIKPDPTRTDASGNPTRIVFGLEEMWEINLDDTLNQNPTGFVVPRTIGRYFGNGFCAAGVVPAAGIQVNPPVCPFSDDAPTTTHPDQHGGIWIPDGKGGVTLLVGNDGGVFGQHVDSSGDFANNAWGNGLNLDMPTTLNYNLAVSGDGIVYTGLQDNGEVRIEPTGRQVEVFGGDAFFSATDPANSKVVYEEYTFGNMNVSTDGGHTWASINPGLTAPQFSTPFAVDPTDANHLVTGGQDIQETVSGPNTTVALAPSPVPSSTSSTDWAVVYTLPSGDAVSAVDTRGDDTYVGFCGPCYIPSTVASDFSGGIATNVGGGATPKRKSASGWHVAPAAGLPQRYITSVRMDPADPRTIYVTLANYDPTVEERAPGRLGDSTAKVGRGHVFKSTDAGGHFTDISGNLPDAPAAWVITRGDQLIVGTYAGVYISKDLQGKSWALLGGTSLPNTRVSTLQLQPGNPNRLFASTYGRGVWVYDFPAAAQISAGQAGASTSRAIASGASGLPNTAGIVAETARLSSLAGAVLVTGWGLARRRRRRRA